MNNDEIREEEVQEQVENDKSLLKDMAKKGISKTIKTLPLGTKILIFAIAGLVIFLLVFIVLISVLSMYFFFDFEMGGDSNAAYGYTMSENKANYWWPIGGNKIEEIDGKKYAKGNPTTTTISSGYGLRSFTVDGVVKKSFHYGIDIVPSGNTDYVIAVADGEIQVVGTGCPNNEGINSTCNYEMGNYVTIKHNDGNYTRYAHLQPNSITVSQGEKVKQGQVIAEMGNSGSSTGKHLDFKVFVGTINTNGTNPLEFVSQTNTRPKSIESTEKSKLLLMLQSLEGSGPTEGDYYIVYDDGGGTLTVGHGVTLTYQKEKLEAEGIDVDSLEKGSKVPKSAVDAVELKNITARRKNIVNKLDENNIDLEDYQIDALAIRSYNVGNIDGFVDAYKTYGNTKELYDNYMSTPNTVNGEYWLGLDRRRQAEWKLFHEGIYTIK